MKVHYDFQGYATKNDLKCADGRTIRRNAFKECDGTTVPLVWNHIHGDPEMVLGHALLENRNDGVYAYCKLNNNEKAQVCKEILHNGDICGLSIYANQLVQKAGDVVHGVIRELSLVLSPANPGALIDVSIAHGENADSDMYAYLVGEEYTELSHDGFDLDMEDGVEDDNVLVHGEDAGEGDESSSVKDVFDTLNDDQKELFYSVVGSLLDDEDDDEDDEYDDDDDDEDDGGTSMKHNVFYGDNEKNTLTHSDEMDILNLAKEKNVGTLQQAIRIFADDNELQHDAISSGFTQDTTANGNVTWLFPEYKDLRTGAPELITSDQGWISTVLAKVSKSPISRVRTSYVDIRNIDSLRARGYKKGKEKQLTGNFNLVRRTTDPQTVYVKSQLHRDDVIDITDFDYVNYLYKIDKMNLNEELAMAIMLGDFRDDASDDKIHPEHIRPIWTDDEIYTIHRDIDIAGARNTLNGTETDSYFGNSFVYAEAIIENLLFAREDFKGTGTPDLFITPHLLNVMLLARDSNGRRIYSGKGELAQALNVGNIYTAEQFNNRVRTDDNNNKHKLLGLVCNLSDYQLGSTKGGEVTHFTDFDINFNMLISLLETRVSGALTKLWSAIALEEPVTA